MRTAQAIVVWGVATLLVPHVAQAGVYSTLEPKWTISGDYFRKFQEDSLTPLKQLATPAAVQPWQKYYELAASAALVAKDPPPRGQKDSMTVDQRLNLAVSLLRVREPGKGMPEKAIVHLNAALNQEKDNFLVMSTLATAYQMTGDYLHANDWSSEAARYWSKPFDQLSPKHQEYLKETFKWSKDDFDWYAICEKYQRQLVRLRFKELKNGQLSFAKAAEKLDAIFDPDPLKDAKPLRFVGESGTFEPGKLAEVEKAKLPPRAIEIIEQLLIWTPDDMRLLWLLGELFNARGDTEAPKIVWMEFLGKFAQIQSQGLPASIDPQTGQPQIDVKAHLAKFIEKHPQVGQRLQVILDYVPPQPNGANNEPVKAVDNPQPVMPTKLDWQTLAVGLGAGILVGFLIAWRVREMLGRRRRPALDGFHQPVTRWANPPGPGSTGIPSDKR